MTAPDPNGMDQNQKIIHAVGAIVICCQKIEKLLKFLIPYLSSDNPEFSNRAWRHATLEKQPLGVVAGAFASAMTGDTEFFLGYIRNFVNQRNDLVHNFDQKYGADINSGRSSDVLSALVAQHAEAVEFLRILQSMLIPFMETLRDTETVGSAEHLEMIELCERARSVFLSGTASSQLLEVRKT